MTLEEALRVAEGSMFVRPNDSGGEARLEALLVLAEHVSSLSAQIAALKASSTNIAAVHPVRNTVGRRVFGRKKYVLVRVDRERADGDTGGDFAEIAAMLKQTPICPACSGESQERTCCSLETRQIGRRLKRLIDRADRRAESEGS